MTYYNEDGEIFITTKNKYNEDGDITEFTFSKVDFEVVTKHQYNEYDKLNNWILRTNYKDDKLSSITEREIEYYE